jgi:hypothetical protein
MSLPEGSEGIVGIPEILDIVGRAPDGDGVGMKDIPQLPIIRVMGGLPANISDNGISLLIRGNP